MKARLIEAMKAVFGSDQRRINHALSVLGYAETLLQDEPGDDLTVVAAAILHDIGIHEAERKYNSSAGNYQELEGPPIARKILERLGLDAERTDHVCRIISLHHHASGLDTPEFRLLWDADWLVNIPDEYPGWESDRLRPIVEKVFKTPAGRRLAENKYDPVGRFSTENSTVNGQPSTVYTYSYVPGSDLVQGYTTDSGFSLMRAYEPTRNLIASITNNFGDVPLHRFDYVNDAVGRRVQRADVDISTVISNQFAYNIRSELEDAAMGTNTFNYRYDPIGNRTVATNNSVALAYAANSLNQYTNITDSSATSNPSYDLDGNMTAYKDWTFVWDAENRMTGASNATTVANYSYDYMSRRWRKIVNGATNTFLYDGWNLISEISNNGSQIVTNCYVWGLDLSGSHQGAGGVGGVLSVTRNGVPYYPVCDGNGNITDYVDASGTIVAHREFDAYGNTVASSGAMVGEFKFWFSSKYLDAETGLYYYGHRYYQSESGRWCSRDPLGEIGGNLLRLRQTYAGGKIQSSIAKVMGSYRFVDNEPNQRYDFLGMIWPQLYAEAVATCGASHIVNWAASKISAALAGIVICSRYVATDCASEGAPQPSRIIDLGINLHSIPAPTTSGLLTCIAALGLTPPTDISVTAGSELLYTCKQTLIRWSVWATATISDSNGSSTIKENVLGGDCGANYHCSCCR